MLSGLKPISVLALEDGRTSLRVISLWVKKWQTLTFVFADEREGDGEAPTWILISAASSARSTLSGRRYYLPFPLRAPPLFRRQLFISSENPQMNLWKLFKLFSLVSFPFQTVAQQNCSALITWKETEEKKNLSLKSDPILSWTAKPQIFNSYTSTDNCNNKWIT